ncbi:hypothetical protein E2562_039443, partial [Oryza meyeriana var. granulata]
GQGKSFFEMGCNFFTWCHLILFLCVLHSTFGISCCCIPEERAVLMEIRSRLMTAQSEPPISWSGHGDCCSWERITCKNSTRHISHLDLSEIYQPVRTSNFQGLEGLSKLQYLNLSVNNLSGSISGSIGKLVSLKVINLGTNNISGALQDTGNILRQQQIRRGSSQKSFWQCTNHGFTWLTSVQLLDLSDNNFVGPLPNCSSTLPLYFLNMS